MGIHPKSWTPEEDAKLLAVIVTMRGQSYQAIARVAVSVIDRTSNGIVFRIRNVDAFREAAAAPTAPEPIIENQPEAASESNVWGVKLSPLPFAVPPSHGDETRPYDRRTTLYAPAESPADRFKRILREEMRA